MLAYVAGMGGAVVVASGAISIWLRRSRRSESDKFPADEETTVLLGNLFAPMPRHRQDELVHYHSDFGQGADTPRTATYISDQTITPGAFQLGHLPSARLAKIGLLRLQLLLPQHRDKLQDPKEWEDLAASYAMAVEFLADLRRRTDPDASLVEEYETICRELLQQVDRVCRYSDF